MNCTSGFATALSQILASSTAKYAMVSATPAKQSAGDASVHVAAPQPPRAAGANGTSCSAAKSSTDVVPLFAHARAPALAHHGGGSPKAMANSSASLLSACRYAVVAAMAAERLPPSAGDAPSAVAAPM